MTDYNLALQFLVTSCGNKSGFEIQKDYTKFTFPLTGEQVYKHESVDVKLRRESIKIPCDLLQHM